MPERHSTLAHSAYHDLLRSLKSDRVTEIRGSVMRESRANGRAYWYETRRTGTTVRRRYIGEDSPELAADLAERARLQAEAKARAAHRTRLVRLLRGEDFLPVEARFGAILKAMADLGVFRLGGTIVGTHAFRLYEGELGLRYSFDDTAQTGDLDIAQFERLSLALGDQVEDQLAQTFQELDFAPVPSLHRDAVWRWQQTRSDTLVEFLTPSFRPDEDIRPLPALGISAQSLHFLNYLIANPIPAALLYRSGILIQIPRPEAFAIHKLIVADRRRGGPDALKSEKDRRQAAFLIEALAEDRPDELAEAYADALSRGPKWRDHLGRSLARMPATADRLSRLDRL
ncbi:GSU2403 family nucleotidyltransferase fold protein [Gemmobacter caeruleus]|uniref:nucleotidyltransferase family protein n=1 Tax=Gemmobacter caeruleus TaxID=2595004 RepID=UPI0011EECD3E|nr:GSU2403 family nucleotidyltransferase fold protein [Gemmobacter caeruleus]